jgi:hypothetical protein
LRGAEAEEHGMRFFGITCHGSGGGVVSSGVCEELFSG